MTEYHDDETRYEVNHECGNCGGTEWWYDRDVSRRYQLKFICEDCGREIVAMNDPTNYAEQVGVEYNEVTVTRRVRTVELDLAALLEGDEKSSIDRVKRRDP